MKIKTLDYYDSFSCLCGACPDTCCAGWDVEIDRESREKYLRMEGPLGEKACRALQKEDGEWSFRLEGGRCPFLMDSGLCELQAALGESALSRTCRLFPRIPADLGGVREVSLSISCPEAARLLLEHEAPLSVVSRDTDEPPEMNDIDAGWYGQVMALRGRLLALAQNRSLPFPRRLARCVALASDAARIHRSGGDMASACADYAPPASLSPARPFQRLLTLLQGMERLTGRWGGMLSGMAEACENPPGWAYPDAEYENLLVYYLFRYFPEAVYDGTPFLPVKLACVSLCLIRLLWHSQRADDRAARIDLAHLYSREIENSQDNLDALLSLLRHVSFGNLRTMLALIGADPEDA